MDSDRSVGHEPEARSRKVTSRPVGSLRGLFLFAVFVLVACSTQMRSGGSGGFRHGSDAAAIKATLDTTAAGWNRGELPVYLSAYVDSSTAMGSTGLVRGVKGIEGQMRAGYWRTGRPLQMLTYDHLEIRPIGPDQAIVTAHWLANGA